MSAAGLLKGDKADGLSLRTRTVDYLSHKHDTLFVISPHNTEANEHTSADAFNGLAVARAKQLGPTKPFTQTASPVPIVGTDGRRLVHVLAPGVGINFPKLLGTQDTYTTDKGNSFAVPHATGTVALVQDYVWRMSGWGQAEKEAARRHELMKAVLMNSAEKLDGILGAKRTVTDRAGKAWDKSDARDDKKTNDPLGRTIPIAADFGAGFLNAARALDQLKGRRHAPFATNYVPPAPPPAGEPTPVGVIGWDVNSINKTGASTVYNRYRLPTLKGGGWISATLTWDRVLSLRDTMVVNQEYDAGEDFTNPQMANLDLHLMKVGETDVSQAEWSSKSTDYYVEHFLYNLPKTDQAYELWVEQKSAGTANYALAWWGDAAGVPKKKIEGKEWKENLSDGLRLSGEDSLRGVRVDLHDAVTGLFVDTRWTDSTGAFAFQSVEPCSYYLEFHAPYEYGYTTPNVGSDDSIDSDAVPDPNDPTIGRTGTIVVSTTDILNVDAGFNNLNYGSIGDRAWHDTDGDGIQRRLEFEPGIEGVQVDLYKSDDTYVATQWTGADGAYQFNDVAPGSYYLQFNLPDRHGFTLKDQGTDEAVDSDADPATGKTATFTLSQSQSNFHLDAGLKVVGGSVGDRAWFDYDHDGLQGDAESGINDLAVKLYTAAGVLTAETTTDQNGDYWFPTVPPSTYYLQFDRPAGSAFTTPNAGADILDSDVTDPATGRTANFSVTLGAVKDRLDAGIVFPLVGDRVWAETDGDCIQETGELGLAGVTVRLQTTGGTVVLETVTDAQGNYAFTYFDPGTYRIKVVVPTGTLVSPADQADDAIDSDVDASGLTAAFTVAAADVRTNLDAGLVTIVAGPGTLGGAVWYDLDGDGIREAGEPLAGNEVTVQLLDPTGAVIQTVTAMAGWYSFTSVPAGTYRVRFVIPTGNGFTAANQGTDETLDSDVNPASGTTALFTFNGGTDMTWNAGLTGGPPTGEPGGSG